MQTPVEQWRRHDADVDDVASGCSESVDECVTQCRTTRPIVTSDSDRAVCAALVEKRGICASECGGDVRCEIAIDDAAYVILPEDRGRNAGGCGHVTLPFRLRISATVGRAWYAA